MSVILPLNQSREDARLIFHWLLSFVKVSEIFFSLQTHHPWLVLIYRFYTDINSYTGCQCRRSQNRNAKSRSRKRFFANYNFLHYWLLLIQKSTVASANTIRYDTHITQDPSRLTNNVGFCHNGSVLLFRPIKRSSQIRNPSQFGGGCSERRWGFIHLIKCYQKQLYTLSPLDSVLSVLG